MKKKFWSIFVVLCFISIAASLVNAQTNNRFVINIPFDFIVADQMLPAGQYTLERFDPTKPNVLRIKNTDHHMMRVFLTQRVGRNDKMRRTSNLVFRQRGLAYYLYQVWEAEDLNGNQLLTTDEKRDRSQSRNYTLVRLSANKTTP